MWRYKPTENSIEMESGITVMEIHLPTGVTPVQEDLDMVIHFHRNHALF